MLGLLPLSLPRSATFARREVSSAHQRGDDFGNLPREQRRDCVADLFVLFGARPLETVVVGERLQPGGLTDGKAATLRRVE